MNLGLIDRLKVMTLVNMLKVMVVDPGAVR